MEKEKINKLIELLEELQNIEFDNTTDLLKNEKIIEEYKKENKGEIMLDVYADIEILLNFIQKNYIINSEKAWAIKK